MMLLTLHNLAKTYKMLPSEALASATTFDLYVLDIYHRYVKYSELKAQGKAGKQIFENPQKKMPTKAEMQKMWNNVKAMSEERI